jgi:predicted N-acetyltransferase YhbS
VGISAPTPLKAGHDTSSFCCGEPILDDWLKHTALKNEGKSASRTFVACDGNRVIGYYALAAGAIERGDTPGHVRRNMPDPIPVMVLARLAVDTAYQSRNLGKGLLKDAILRALTVSEHIGIKAILVHAISDTAKQFYINQGFRESPTNDMTLMISLDEALRNAR